MQNLFTFKERAVPHQPALQARESCWAMHVQKQNRHEQAPDWSWWIAWSAIFRRQVGIDRNKSWTYAIQNEHWRQHLLWQLIKCSPSKISTVALLAKGIYDQVLVVGAGLRGSALLWASSKQKCPNANKSNEFKTGVVDSKFIRLAPGRRICQWTEKRVGLNAWEEFLFN